MSTLRIFCIPGLGLSSRIFEHINLSEFEVEYLEWIEPQGWESIAQYANRMAKPIGDCHSDVVIIGHSFGGVIAQEISKWKPVKQVVLISTMRYPDEAPGRLKLLGNYGLHRMISKEVILFTFPFWARTHSYRTPELRKLFRDSVKRLSSKYFQWSLWQLATWQGCEGIRTPILRLHGLKDLTFMARKTTSVDHMISDGDHNMIYSKGDDLSEIIQRHIQNSA